MLALRDIFQTKNEVILMPGSGRTALEAAARPSSRRAIASWWSAPESSAS